MSQFICKGVLSWFQSQSIHLSEKEINSLRTCLVECEVDEQLLELCDEKDFKAIVPDDWTFKNKLLLGKAFKFLQDRRAQNRATTPGSTSTVSTVVHMQPTEENVATDRRTQNRAMTPSTSTVSTVEHMQPPEEIGATGRSSTAMKHVTDAKKMEDAPHEKEPKAAFTTGNFQLKDEARNWPVICHIDKASGTIHNEMPVREMTSNFKRVVVAAGFDTRKMTHHCNRAGMATTFIINECISNNGVFPRESVATLCRLAGWSEKSGTWALYIKEVFERHLDGNAFLYRNLRADHDKSTYLKRVKSHYNYRLVAPERNLATKQDCQEVTGFDQYLDRYEDQALGCTVGDAKRALREINENKQDGALGMSKASLTRRLATVTNRAVAQFAAEKNEAAHDRQWGKSIAPHPDKEAFKEPLNVLEYLERRKPSVQVDKLSLRRFSPADYAMPLEEPVRCPYGSCNFETLSGDAMSAHQERTKHPGWQRYGERPSERSWVCQAKGCQSTFHQWNNLYNHMLGHSQPLSCPECSFRTGRGNRLSEHIKKVHSDSQIPSGHFLKQANSLFLKL